MVRAAILESARRAVICAALFVSCGIHSHTVQPNRSISITDMAQGCTAERIASASGAAMYEWAATPDGYVLKGRKLPNADLESTRQELLSSYREPEDLVMDLGVTPAVIEWHRSDILAAATVQDSAVHTDEASSTKLNALLDFERLRRLILLEVTGKNWRSTVTRHMRIVLPGEPEVELRSDGLVPGMLPWTITANGRSWRSADPSVSLALLPLLTTESSNFDLLANATYWQHDFWHDQVFWRRHVGSFLASSASDR